VPEKIISSPNDENPSQIKRGEKAFCLSFSVLENKIEDVGRACLKLLIKWVLLTLSILIVSYLLEGVKVEDFSSALMAAALLGILNSLVRPLLILLTLPINLITFGIFIFIINAILLMLVSHVITGFHVAGFWTAVFGSILISVSNALLNWLIKDNRPSEPPRSSGVIDLEEKEKGRWE